MFHKDFLSIRIFSVYICFVFNIIRMDIYHFFEGKLHLFSTLDF